ERAETRRFEGAGEGHGPGPGPPTGGGDDERGHDGQLGEGVGEEPGLPDAPVRLPLNRGDRCGIQEGREEGRYDDGRDDEDDYPAQRVETPRRVAEPPDAAGCEQCLAAVGDRKSVV